MMASLVSIASNAPSNMVSAGPLFQLVEPFLVSALGALLAGLIAWATALLQKWVGITVDQAHREALHSAAMTGVNIALSKLGVEANNLSFDVKSQVIAHGVEWVEQSVPAALKHLGVTPYKVSAIVESKVGTLAASMGAVLPAAQIP